MELLEFNVQGHKNLQGKHKSTLEFTRDKELNLHGDCIIGVNADFNLNKIRKFIAGAEKIKMTLTINELAEEILFDVNSNFNDAKEIVIRLGEYKSNRTLGTHASKSAKMINRQIIKLMKSPKQMMVVKLEKTTK